MTQVSDHFPGFFLQSDALEPSLFREMPWFCSGAVVREATRFVQGASERGHSVGVVAKSLMEQRQFPHGAIDHDRQLGGVVLASPGSAARFPLRPAKPRRVRFLIGPSAGLHAPCEFGAAVDGASQPSRNG